MGLKENKVERYLKDCVKENNGYCFKLTGYIGIPDRLIVLPGKPAVFCEAKAEEGVVAPAQRIMLNRLRTAGFMAELVFSEEDVDALLKRVLKEVNDEWHIK